MRTTNFSQVLFDSLQYSGNDRQNISDDTFAQFRDFCSARLRESWESNQWSDICRIVPFTTAYDTIVDINGDLQKTAYFTPATESSEILGVFSRNPQSSTKAVNITYSIYEDNGVRKIIINNQIATGYYLYRIKCPELVGSVYDSLTVYFNNSQIYFDSGSGTGTYTPVSGKPHSGNFYTCTANTTTAGQSPSTTPSAWSIVQIPYVFGSYMAYGATANWLASELMIQEAATMEAKAKEVIDLEYDKFLHQQGQFGRINMFKTY